MVRRPWTALSEIEHLQANFSDKEIEATAFGKVIVVGVGREDAAAPRLATFSRRALHSHPYKAGEEFEASEDDVVYARADAMYGIGSSIIQIRPGRERAHLLVYEPTVGDFYLYRGERAVTEQLRNAGFLAPRAGLEERGRAMVHDVGVVRDAIAALAALPEAPASAAGTPVLVFTDPRLFDLALVAARAGRPVAIQSDGVEAQRLRALRAALLQQGVALGPFAIGTTEATHLLAEYDRSVPVETRSDALRRLGLREDDLPPAVAQALTATRDFLNLARGA